MPWTRTLTRKERNLLIFAASHLEIEAESHAADGMESQRRVGRRLYEAVGLLRHLADTGGIA